MQEDQGLGHYEGKDSASGLALSLSLHTLPTMVNSEGV